MIQSPWAVLLCKFKGDAAEPYVRQRYEELFTSSGVGKLNMIDFFRDMSHGMLDLSGSQVFGWYTLDKKRSEYKPCCTKAEIQKARNDLIAWARQAAIADKKDLSKFFSVVVCMNVPTGLFGGGAGAVCDDDRDPINGMSNMSPSLLGQEMGHAYGLSHSRAEGSAEDYKDRWDVMSTKDAAFMAPHPNFTEIDVQANPPNPLFRLGPGLNAANMWSRGWLDKSRVWETSARTVDTVVTLRPLHRRDLPGFLAIQFEEYFVEFRNKEGWDADIPNPCVLVHRFDGGHSYLVSDSNGQQDFGVGSVIEGAIEIPGVVSAATSIKVLEINANQQLAKIRLHHHATIVNYINPEEQPFRNPGVRFGVITNGNVFHISRLSPLFKTLEHVALYESSEAISSVQLRNAVRRETLSAIVALAQEQMETLQDFRQPAPVPQTETSVGTQSSSSD